MNTTQLATEDILADNEGKNQACLFAMGETGIQRHHANEYNAATSEDIPSDN